MLMLDTFAARYGWTWDQIQDTPVTVLRSLQRVWGIRASVYERQQPAPATVTGRRLR